MIYKVTIIVYREACPALGKFGQFGTDQINPGQGGLHGADQYRAHDRI